MEKILNTRGLGVSGRQNELIELALTFDFNSVEVDMNDLIGRHDTMGKEFACQFLKSTELDVGIFDLPVDIDASDEQFNKACEQLDTIFSLCEALGGKRCRVQIATSSDEPFQQNFERHRTRLFELGEKFAAKDMHIGLTNQLPGANEKDNKFIHSAEELLTLVKTIGHANVGLYLDTWTWKATGGAMDQISDLDTSKITALAMADLSENSDPANLTPADRVLPGDSSTSFSIDVFNRLKADGYEGPISFATYMSTFANSSRDTIVNRISKRLDCMVSGESFDTIDERPISAIFAESNSDDRADRGKDSQASAKGNEGEKNGEAKSAPDTVAAAE